MKIIYNEDSGDLLENLASGTVFLYRDKFFIVTDETAAENENILVVALDSGVIQRYGPKLKVKPQVNAELVVE